MTEPTWKDWLKGFLLMLTIFGIMILPVVFLHGATAWETFAFVGWIVCVILTLNVKQHPEVRAMLAGDWDELRRIDERKKSNKEVAQEHANQEINPQAEGTDL